MVDFIVSNDGQQTTILYDLIINCKPNCSTQILYLIKKRLLMISSKKDADLVKMRYFGPEYPNKPFETIEQARVWVTKFVHWYNNIHQHSGIKFVTPNQRHQGLDHKILSNRIAVYEKAKSLNPNRWTKNIRNWSVIGSVCLNHTTAKQAITG